jgi:hypothetical protein
MANAQNPEPMSLRCVAQREVDLSLGWLRAFKVANGRPLRVLHIGNIANNAYNNAKIQRTHGIEADVLCYDYYHVMGTPEWEDGGLETPVDGNLPDWWSTNLEGFKRPSWFVQGPASLCVKYLNSRAKGQMFLAKLRRWALNGAYWKLVADKASQTGVRRIFYERQQGLRPYIYAVFMRLGLLIEAFDPWVGMGERLASTRSSLRNRVLVPLTIATTASPPLMRGASALTSFWRWQKRRRSLSEGFDRRALADSDTEKVILSNFSLGRIIISSVAILSQALLETSLHLFLWPLRLIWRQRDKEKKLRTEKLLAMFRQQEPNVPDGTWEKLRRYLEQHVIRFEPALESYDIVQGYSIDGIVPLSVGFANFCCYEHGTLRDIPFENTMIGLICRLAYKNAPYIFITNSDVVGSVERLGLDRERVCLLPHAFDDLKLDNFRINNPSIQPDQQTAHFFCPSRQHWRDHDPSLTKGSDIMLRAAAAVATEGHEFKLTLVEWGVDVEASKQLIRELDLEPFVSWVPPMDKRALWKEYCRSHAVLDQFSLAALGGVGFETLALGCRLITRIDVDQLRIFFGCAPPVLPATNQSEIVTSIRSVILDPGDIARVGAAGRQWIKDYHSARRIVALQSKAYRNLLQKGSSPSPAQVISSEFAAAATVVP